MFTLYVLIFILPFPVLEYLFPESDKSPSKIVRQIEISPDQILETMSYYENQIKVWITQKSLASQFKVAHSYYLKLECSSVDYIMSCDSEEEQGKNLIELNVDFHSVPDFIGLNFLENSLGLPYQVPCTLMA